MCLYVFCSIFSQKLMLIKVFGNLWCKNPTIKLCVSGTWQRSSFWDRNLAVGDWGLGSRWGSRVKTSSRRDDASSSFPSFSFLWAWSRRPSALLTWNSNSFIRTEPRIWPWFACRSVQTHIVQAESGDGDSEDVSKATESFGPQQLHKRRYVWGQLIGVQFLLQQQLKVIQREDQKHQGQ